MSIDNSATPSTPSSSPSSSSPSASPSALATHAEDAVARAASIGELEQLRVQWLGKKGEVTVQLKQLGDATGDERRARGRELNELKQHIQRLLDERRVALEESTTAAQLRDECIDVTLPGRAQSHGALHPVSRTLARMQAIFAQLGFDIASGPEIEDEHHNFEALNFPPDHPAREMHDTFYLRDRRLLRTHTSPVQIRYMRSHAPPLMVIAPGRVYRCDSDVTHTPMFHQLEGLAIDRDMHFGDLKGVLIHFVREFFETDLQVRFRPSYFPFTEPSAEVDIACVFCGGDGCRVCKHSGWIEVLGSGMVHPAVLRHGGVNPNQFSGYAFGLGVERLAMLRYGVNDLRLFFENDIAFLKQFGAF